MPTLIDWEEEERRSRSLKRRLADACLGQFKPLADFDWDWPRRCDRMVVQDLMSLDFLNEAANVVLVGPNGVDKSTIAANIAHRAVLKGHTVRFSTAAGILGELAALDSDTLLQRRLRFYARQHLLVIDEVGYLSYSTGTARAGNRLRSPEPALRRFRQHGAVVEGRGPPAQHRPGLQIVARIAYPRAESVEHRPAAGDPVAGERLHRQAGPGSGLLRVRIPCFPRHARLPSPGPEGIPARAECRRALNARESRRVDDRYAIFRRLPGPGPAIAGRHRSGTAGPGSGQGPHAQPPAMS